MNTLLQSVARCSAVLVTAMALACAVQVVSAADEIAVKSPLEPVDSLRQLRVEPGLKVELVAAEPQVVDPVAMRFDEDGRLWVVEMRDYPHGPKPGQEPRSRIVVLHDNDGDGRFERSTTFAEKLLFPTGVQPWRQGVIVTLAGEVAYMKDSDGDGRADLRETWYRGFTAENPQLRANHPRLALDNRVYVSGGLRGGSVVDPRRPNQPPVQIGGMDFRFDPLTGDCEAATGNGQFGNTFDQFGRRFVCMNSNPVQHVVLDNRFLRRNPLLAVPGVLADVANPSEKSRLFPLSKAWTTSNLHAGKFTAACGVEIFGGDALGLDYRGNALVCEPTGSLVHREIVAAAGATFAARPARNGAEFLASTDSWFRPVNLETGPDGALYVVDMYRAVIEHPEFMPDELKRRPDLESGNDRGRIYRVVRADRRVERAATAKLSQATSNRLVELLSDPGSWWRDTAARLLVERQDKSVGAALELTVRRGNAAARARALWLLDGLGLLTPDHLLRAIDDSDSRVAEQGVLLAERRPTDSAQHAALRAAIAARADADDPRLRFVVALALGNTAGESCDPLVRIAQRDAADSWTRLALASSVPALGRQLLLKLLSAEVPTDPSLAAGRELLVSELSLAVGRGGQPVEVAELLGALLPAGERAAGDQPLSGEPLAALRSLAEGLRRQGTSLIVLVASLPAENGSLAARFDRALAAACAAALDSRLGEPSRIKQIALLRFDRSDRSRAALVRLLAQERSGSLRIAAIEALSTHDHPDVGRTLLADYSAQTPPVRRAVLDALLARADRAALLLDELAAGRMARGELDPARADRLRRHPDAAIRARTASVLADQAAGPRRQVLETYRVALTLKADPATGREVFRKQCSACHRIAGLGVDVAPDISDSREKQPEQLLTDVLDPNRAVDGNYVSYVVATRDGQVLTGVIAAETATSITLRQQENKTVSLARGDVESIRSTGLSLMPEGLEREIPPQSMADLIAFIKNWRYLEQDVPGVPARRVP